MRRRPRPGNGKAANFARSLSFVLRSLLLLPSGSAVVLALEGDVLQMALRLLGPVLIGLVALGLRARVQR